MLLNIISTLCSLNILPKIRFQLGFGDLYNKIRKNFKHDHSGCLKVDLQSAAVYIFLFKSKIFLIYSLGRWPIFSENCSGHYYYYTETNTFVEVYYRRSSWLNDLYKSNIRKKFPVDLPSSLAQWHRSPPRS